MLITLIATGMAWPKGADKATHEKERKTVEPRIAERAEPARAPEEPALPVNSGHRRQPVVASNPRAEPELNEAHAVEEPPTARQERSSDTPANEEIDLEVPSFLRRRRPPDPGEQ